MSRININDIKIFDQTSITEEEMDEKAMKAAMRIQDYHDRKEMGLLTDEEKLAEVNTQIFNDYVDKVGGIENIKPEELNKLFKTKL